ncbi:UNVERIFIED_CONTAM: hypothetical protein FKN15_063089 [Acipenser sinensis]
MRGGTGRLGYPHPCTITPSRVCDHGVSTVEWLAVLKCVLLSWRGRRRISCRCGFTTELCDSNLLLTEDTNVNVPVNCL